MWQLLVLNIYCFYQIVFFFFHNVMNWWIESISGSFDQHHNNRTQIFNIIQGLDKHSLTKMVTGL